MEHFSKNPRFRPKQCQNIPGSASTYFLPLCSTPAQVVALSRREDGRAADDPDKDNVFVDGDVAEACQTGNGDTLDQRELLDSTDALLMDATNKMDDTAFLDEVINRNCRSYGSTDDDYIDEVIARCYFQ